MSFYIKLYSIVGFHITHIWCDISPKPNSKHFIALWIVNGTHETLCVCNFVGFQLCIWAAVGWFFSEAFFWKFKFVRLFLNVRHQFSTLKFLYNFNDIFAINKLPTVKFPLDPSPLKLQKVKENPFSNGNVLMWAYHPPIKIYFSVE